MGGCSSPSPRPCNVCDAWPVRHQTHGYLPSHKTSPAVGWYQIILLGDRGTRVVTTCPGLYSTAGRSGFEPAACWMQVQHTNHSATIKAPKDIKFLLGSAELQVKLTHSHPPSSRCNQLFRLAVPKSKQTDDRYRTVLNFNMIINITTGCANPPINSTAKNCGYISNLKQQNVHTHINQLYWKQYMQWHTSL